VALLELAMALAKEQEQALAKEQGQEQGRELVGVPAKAQQQGKELEPE
jgi:hypothetical protein